MSTSCHSSGLKKLEAKYLSYHALINVTYIRCMYALCEDDMVAIMLSMRIRLIYAYI